jgi:hypothetical protein
MYPSESESPTDTNGNWGAKSDELDAAWTIEKSDGESTNGEPDETYDTSTSNEADHPWHYDEVPVAPTNEEPREDRPPEKRDANVKRTLKYLAICKDPRAYREVVRAASDRVIRTICKAAFNVEQGPVRLSPAQKTLFRAHRKSIALLSSKRGGIKAKRKTIASQKGGFPFIPLLIGSALGALGSRLFGGTSANPPQQ